MRYQTYSQARNRGSGRRMGGILTAVGVCATVALIAGPATLIGGSLVVLGAALHGR